MKSITSSPRNTPRASAAWRSTARRSGSLSTCSWNTWPQPSRVRRSSRSFRSAGGSSAGGQHAALQRLRVHEPVEGRVLLHGGVQVHVVQQHHGPALVERRRLQHARRRASRRWRPARAAPARRPAAGASCRCPRGPTGRWAPASASGCRPTAAGAPAPPRWGRRKKLASVGRAGQADVERRSASSAQPWYSLLAR